MSRDYWDAQAASFDDEPDHGLRDPAARSAWRDLLRAHLPEAPVQGLEPLDVADLGCGTGTLALLLAEDGHRVRALDYAPAMVEAARAKLAGHRVEVVLGDAADPPYAPGSCDVVLVRHVLWALPDPRAAVRRWVELLRPDGRLLLIEGRWHTGGGIAAAECRRLVRQVRRHAEVTLLTDKAYWGAPVTDERYVLTSVR